MVISDYQYFDKDMINTIQIDFSITQLYFYLQKMKIFFGQVAKCSTCNVC